MTLFERHSVLFNEIGVIMRAVVFFLVAHTIAALRRETYIIVVATKLLTASVCVYTKIKLRATVARGSSEEDFNLPGTAAFDN